jgi:hypothetical protein
MKTKANPRSALDARTALCFHIGRHWERPLARHEHDVTGTYKSSSLGIQKFLELSPTSDVPQ